MGLQEIIAIEYLSQPEVFADLFNGVVFGGKQVIKPEELYETDTRQQFMIAEQTANHRPQSVEILKKDRDIVREVVLNGQRVRILACAVEQQTNVNYIMPLRMLLYEALEYLKQVQKISREHEKHKDLHGDEYISRFAKTDELIPTISIVVYTGTKQWDGALELKDLYGGMLRNEELKPYMNQFLGNWRIHLLDVYNVEDTSVFHSSFRIVLEMLRTSKDAEQLEHYVTEHKMELEELNEISNRFVSWLLEIDLELEEEERRADKMCKAIEDLKKMAEERGKVIGEAIGEERGKAQGIEFLLIDQVRSKIKKDKPLETIADELEQEVDSIRPIYEAVLLSNPDYDCKQIYAVLHGEE